MKEFKTIYYTKIVVLIILFLTINNSFVLSQSILKDIPDSLINNSHMVIVDEQFKFTIINEEKTIQEVSKDFIVLKNSKHIPKYLFLYYSDFIKVSKANVRIYDCNDNLIKKFSRSDFLDHLLVDGSIATDAGMKFIILPEISLPYRVVFTYKQVSKNSLFYPEWEPISDEYQSVLSAQLQVVDKLKNNLRYKLYKLSKPKIENNKKSKAYTWVIKNRKAMRFEPFNDIREDYFSKVLISPKKFEVDDFKGNMSSWKSFGQWINKLNKGRNTLNENEIQEIKSLVNENDSKLEKINKIYKYLQNNTRYASIQLGIGGWQPFESGYTHNKKYGDCKALTYYTQSMLDAVDITSYYTLVRAGKKSSKVPIDFPNAKFNHAFLMVPVDNDTIWLECTSQTVPFGYTGYFTDDRNVLVIKEDGGHLIKSKCYGSNHNINKVSVDIKMESNGVAIVLLKDEMTGVAIERKNYFHYINNGIKEYRKWLLDNLDFGNFELLKFKMNPILGSLIPVSSFEVSLKLPDFGTVAGDNLIIKPFIFNKSNFVKLVEKKREHNIFIDRSFILEDSINIEIPNGYKLTTKAEPFEMKTEFGNLIFSIKTNKNSIFFYKKIEVLKGEYSKDKYNSFKSFINAIIKKENQRFVLVK